MIYMRCGWVDSITMMDVGYGQINRKKGGDWNKSKSVEIPDLGLTVSNYLYPFTVKHDSSIMKNKFEDIRFTQSGNVLSHYRESIDCELSFTSDMDLQIQSGCVLDDDTILVHKTGTNEIYKSVDNGESFALYSTLPNVTNYRSGRMFVASNGYIYIGVDAKLFRSINNGETFTKVHDLPISGSWSEMCNVWNFVEDQNGYIYGGVYPCPASSSTKAYIIKSVDNGANWTNTWESASFRHVHGMYFNPYKFPDY